MSYRIAALLVALAGALAGASRAEEALFPFVISYDTPENLTNVASWLERPAGKQGFVRAVDGHLATDAGPIRFWATNLCFDACFPTRENAERVAVRLARLGINCVRLHHMDSRNIWGKSPDHLTIDPDQLRRLDYLISQLKLHGVYVDINLHVSRWLGQREGFVAREQRPQFDKGLDNFEPRMIELQRNYARDLLTHVNPYTKTAYAQEPAVAFVEINNENALFAQWGWGQLDDLPEPYAATFRKLWNAWLRKKYGDSRQLDRAWNVGRAPLGREMLVNGDFAAPLGKSWHVETDDRTQTDVAIRPEGPEGHPCLRIAVSRAGRVAWRPQLVYAGFAVQKGAPYTLTCWLKADQERRISVNCMMAHEPWQRLGLSGQIKVGPAWKQHRFAFVAEADDANARLSFSDLGLCTLELAQVSLRPGGVFGLEPGQRLEDDSVPVLPRNGMSVTKTGRADFIDFLWDTEHDYWSGMYRFLKDELQVRSLVSGTQLGYSPLHVQAGLDYIDAHSYWQHPHFPGRPWDMQNWTVENVALVNSPGGILAGLAVRRVAGKAYTVSEYNHPQPNQYTAEGFSMVAAFGAFQGWDAIFSFAYCHNDRFEPRRIESFFDIKSDTPKMAHMPACAAMFLRGDVAPAQKILAVPISPEAERGKLHETLNAWNLTADQFGLDPRLSLLHGVAIDPNKAGPLAPAMAPLDKKARLFVSDTGQLRWDLSREGAGCFTVDTPRSKLFTGFVGGRTFALGNVSLAIGPTRLDWATISLVCIDGPGFDRPGRVLVTATGLVQNTGAQLKQVGGNKVTLGNHWGEEPILCEGIPAEIVLPAPAECVTCYALDESGGRRGAIAVADRDGRATLTLHPKYKTVWYEVEIR